MLIIYDHILDTCPNDKGKISHGSRDEMHPKQLSNFVNSSTNEVLIVGPFLPLSQGNKYTPVSSPSYLSNNGYLLTHSHQLSVPSLKFKSLDLKRIYLKDGRKKTEPPGDHRKLQLNELNELRDQAYENSLIYKERTKKLHDSKIKNRIFNVGDQVLLFNSRLKIFSGKLKTRWSGPFTIAQVFPYGTVELSQPEWPNSNKLSPVYDMNDALNSKRGPEFTWERKDQFKKKYPHLFTKNAPSSSAASYGYMKNHMKTVKNGQTRTQERKSEQKPEAKARKRVIKSIHGIVNKMAGSNGSNQSISLAPKHQSHVAMEKAQRNEEFALHSLTKLAQAVTS
ncbi:hypothetical protein Tco_1406207 [Tanacetum coccineum]